MSYAYHNHEPRLIKSILFIRIHFVNIKFYNENSKI